MKMISVKTKFKHGGDTFYPEERRMVSDDDAAYFAQHGWATAEGHVDVDATPSDVKLDVQNGKHINKGRAL